MLYILSEQIEYNVNGRVMESLIKKAAGDIIRSQYAVALTGAGMSTESGIPDFRGPEGIWTKNPDAERKAYETYTTFLNDPAQYWVERLTQPSLHGTLEGAEPNSGHKALAELEMMGLLKSVITQNIDGLHEKAGSKRVLEYHGNIYKLRCSSCGVRFRREEYNLEQMLQEDKLPPLCIRCNAPVKADVVHFTEPIPTDVSRESLEEAYKCDLMLICGTSAVVYPFASLPRIAREKGAEIGRRIEPGSTSNKTGAVTIIEINAEPTPLTSGNVSNYLIQGKTAEILPRIIDCVKSLVQAG
jgi:NAD-dependent deacetylase